MFKPKCNDAMVKIRTRFGVGTCWGIHDLPLTWTDFTWNYSYYGSCYITLAFPSKYKELTNRIQFWLSTISCFDGEWETS